MPSKSAPALKDVLLWSLFLPIAAAALQQQPYAAYPSKPTSPDSKLSDAAASVEQRWRAAAADSLDAPLSGQRGYRDTHVDNKERSRRTSLNERAIATLSPAERNPAVRAHPALRSSSTASAGLASRQPARSLQDWKVEDIILLATVDGKIHARDRMTGAPKWQLEADRPMVETIFHRHDESRDRDKRGLESDDPLWIVEPSQDGSIYVYVPGSGYGMQRLGKTVRQLEELSPYAGDGQPAVTYTAEKKNTLYTVDAGTGNILKMFSSSGSISNEDRSCRRVNPLESLDDDECEPMGTLTIGRTEYTIAIQDRNTAEPISTIKYFEWGPNNRDQDLRSQYTMTMDRKYVYPKHDGTIFSFDLGQPNGYRPIPANKPSYREKFTSPVVRVYDVVRSVDEVSSDASLVVLPQPIGPSLNDFEGLEDDLFESVFVNCTENGTWYALSESNYPMVTDGAKTAACYSDDFFSVPALPMSKAHRESFMGLHQLSPHGHRSSTPLIGAPDYLGIEAPPEEINETRDLISPAPASSWDIPPLMSLLVVALMALAGASGVFYQQKKGTSVPQILQPTLPTPITVSVPDVPVNDEEQPGTPMLREGEPAKETIFPHEGEDNESSDASPGNGVTINHLEEVKKVEFEDADEEVKGTSTGAVLLTLVTLTLGMTDVNKPKGHKRGKRGGRKQKEKEQAQAEAKAKRKNSQVPQPAEVITVAASESPQVSGPLQINSLVIQTDKVIGQGSCGTSVFEGSFEGRDVAVKRMLSQYYELASQEVSFLQQSDDHPNVVRYFCQQKDDHFLYIAVELCQASLFEVWEAEKARTEERQMQLRSLKLSIQRDTPRALQQLAAGLYHLHNLRIIHRDIKPQNILVAFPKRNQNSGPRLVISDFGLGKNLPENVSTLIDPTGNAGTSGWKAPELISQPKETDSKHSHSNHTGGSESANGTNGTSGVKRAADIFSLGCLFFWVLTDGIHPYEDENGWQQLRELNIKRDNKKMGVLERWSDAYEPMQLISSMLEHQPENRPTALQVLNHPFFWPAEKRLAFLCDCSDHFEREARGVVDDGYEGDSYDLRLLEDRAEEVIGAPFERADFLNKLDRHFVDTLGKQRKYSGNRLLDLLRALRNKKNHYEDMPEDVKKRVGPLAGGYLNYWSNRFPRLLMACYEVVHEAGIQSGDRFKGYFAH